MTSERFMKVYAYLPLEERKLTVVVIDGEPVSWTRAWKEVQGKTDLGDCIVKKLVQKGFI